MATRIMAHAEAVGIPARTFSNPNELPSPSTVRLLFVNWSERDATWAHLLATWRDQQARGSRSKLILFGPHTDLDAHAAARSAGLGPMLARSKLIATLPDLVK